VPVEGQPFKEALQAVVREQTPNPWDVQLQTRTAAPIRKGDVLLATFQFRTEASRQESSEGETEFVLELGRPPWTKSASFPVRAGRQWKKVHVPFRATMDHPAGEAHVNFRLGFQVQTIQIAAVTVESFGRALPLAALPVTKITYPGSEPDASWRKSAEERIEKIRKGDLEVTVKDRGGRPLGGAAVSARLTRHQFGFGTCVPAERVVGGSGAGGDDRYRKTLVELFNVATLENDLKWVPLAGDWGPGFTLERARAGVAWLRGQGLDVRGHVLVWPGWRNLPQALKAREKDPAFLRQAVEARIREAAGATKGTLIHWDVVNEPFDNHDLLDILGEEVMIDWFKLARAVDPGPKLYINDYAILAGGGGDTPHRAHYEKMIKLLIDKGAPLDGVGIQGHFGTSLTGPEDMLAILDRYGKLGKPIWITEYDVVLDDEELAGRFTHDFYTTLFSHPAVAGIVMWGFWDGAHWKGNAALYRRDWTEKPGGAAYRILVQDRWRTRAQGMTDAQGRFAARGFLGDYEIQVSQGGKTKTVTCKLAAGGARIAVAMD
jgi:GH35 family endo-1,4-beta-xylanase